MKIQLLLIHVKVKKLLSTISAREYLSHKKNYMPKKKLKEGAASFLKSFQETDFCMNITHINNMAYLKP